MRKYNFLSKPKSRCVKSAPSITQFLESVTYSVRFVEYTNQSTVQEFEFVPLPYV